MDERKSPDIPSDTSDFNTRKDLLIRRALQLATNIQSWGLALAKEKLGEDLVDRALSDEEKVTGPDDDDPKLTHSQRILQAFAHSQLEPLLKKAYDESKGEKSLIISITPELCRGSLVVMLDNDTRALGLFINNVKAKIDYGDSGNITSTKELEEIEEIINDTERAFGAIIEQS